MTWNQFKQLVESTPGVTGETAIRSLYYDSTLYKADETLAIRTVNRDNQLWVYHAEKIDRGGPY